MTTLLGLGLCLARASSVLVTALVLCAETSGLRTEARGVGQVVLNRVASPLYPDTIAGVVLQPGQFATTSQCGEGWLRRHHFETSLAMHRGRRLRSWGWMSPRVLGFMTPARWREHGARYRERGWSVAGVSYTPRDRLAHVYLKRER